MAAPNILLITTDQEQSFVDLPSGLVLPGHERLRERALAFRNFQVNTTPCGPSRFVIYSGQHTQKTRLFVNPHDIMFYDATGTMSNERLDPVRVPPLMPAPWAAPYQDDLGFGLPMSFNDNLDLKPSAQRDDQRLADLMYSRLPAGMRRPGTITATITSTASATLTGMSARFLMRSRALVKRIIRSFS